MTCFALSGEIARYRDRCSVTETDARTDTVTLANGLELTAGTAAGNVTETDKRRLQIREAIAAHLERERALFEHGVCESTRRACSPWWTAY